MHTSIAPSPKKKDKDLTSKLMFTTFMFRENQNLGLGKKMPPLHEIKKRKGGQKQKLEKQLRLAGPRLARRGGEGGKWPMDSQCNGPLN